MLHRIYTKPKIFINYRRDDSSGYAGRLYDDLSEAFGMESITMDVKTIKGGENYLSVIKDKVNLCDIILVTMSKSWLAVADNGKRRLDFSDDLLKLEIITAFEANKHVIPVLVQGSRMPKDEELPTELKKLLMLQAIEISDSRWDYDFNLLVKRILELDNHKVAQKYRWIGGISLFIGIIISCSAIFILNQQPETGGKARHTELGFGDTSSARISKVQLRSDTMVGIVVSDVKILFDALQEKNDISQEYDQEFFTSFIEPLYNKLDLVHESYLESFHNYRTVISNSEKPLNEDHPIFELMRKDHAWSDKDRANLVALSKYVNSHKIRRNVSGRLAQYIISYVTTPADEMRWVFNGPRSTLFMKLNATFRSEESSLEKKRIAIELIDGMVEKLQKNYEIISISYLDMKGQLLR